MRFVRLALASDCDPDGMGAMMLNGAYVTIADEKSYRDPQDSDRLLPLHENVRVPLQKSGFSTIAELVTAIRNPRDGIGNPPTVVPESVWNILAMMDLWAADQHVWTLVSDLESAISGTFVRA